MTPDTPLIETRAIESAEERQRRLFRTIAQVGSGVTTGALVLAFLLGLVAPQFPFEYLIPLLATFIAISLLSLWLNQRGQFRWAIALYMTGTTAFLFTAMYFVNGFAGPIAITLIEIPVIAAMLGGRRAARRMVFIVSILYGLMALLETLGIIQPWQILGPNPGVVTFWMVILSLTVTALFVARSSDQMTRALDIAQKQSERLAKETQRAEAAATAEKEARAREERTALQLRQTVYNYAAFLERVIAGDYEARLDLDQIREGGRSTTELVALGHQLNTTVESLVAAMKDVQATQQRYIAETWESFLETTSARASFRYENGEMAPAEDAWLDTMSDTLQNADLTVQDGELAIPMMLRGEMIGVIGIHKRGGDEWTDDELALARAVVDQLVQTIETLRLLEDTQRRAAREQTVGQMTTHFTQSLDMETLLQTAVRELGQALGVDEVSVHVGTPTPTGGNGAEEEAAL